MRIGLLAIEALIDYSQMHYPWWWCSLSLLEEFQQAGHELVFITRNPEAAARNVAALPDHEIHCLSPGWKFGPAVGGYDLVFGAQLYVAIKHFPPEQINEFFDLVIAACDRAIYWESDLEYLYSKTRMKSQRYSYWMEKQLTGTLMPHAREMLTNCSGWVQHYESLGFQSRYLPFFLSPSLEANINKKAGPDLVRQTRQMPPYATFCIGSWAGRRYQLDWMQRMLKDGDPIAAQMDWYCIRELKTRFPNSKLDLDKTQKHSRYARNWVINAVRKGRLYFNGTGNYRSTWRPGTMEMPPQWYGPKPLEAVMAHRMLLTLDCPETRWAQMPDWSVFRFTKLAEDIEVKKPTIEAFLSDPDFYWSAVDQVCARFRQWATFGKVFDMKHVLGDSIIKVSDLG